MLSVSTGRRWEALTCAVRHPLTGGIDGLLAGLPLSLVHAVFTAGTVTITEGERQRGRERVTERKKERKRERERDREKGRE